jgi:hypothetical protein
VNPLIIVGVSGCRRRWAGERFFSLVVGLAGWLVDFRFLLQFCAAKTRKNTVIKN